MWFDNMIFNNAEVHNGAKPWMDFEKKTIYLVNLSKAWENKKDQLETKAPSDLQPHSCNEVFSNVYLLALDNTKR